MNKTVDMTSAVRIARAALAWWEEQPEFDTCASLFLKEPEFVRRARRVVAAASEHKVVLNVGSRKASPGYSGGGE